MFFSAVEWLNGLMNYKEWFNENIFQLLSEIICSRCIVIFIVDAFLFGLWNSEINCYLQVDALGLGSWEWCEGGGGAIRASTFTWLVMFSREY